MERYGQFRDRGSGISPFIPVKTPRSILKTLLLAPLFFVRLPLFIGYSTVYFLLLHRLPLPAALRKVFLWIFMSIPLMWWIDLQMDGVRRGTLAEQPPDRIPHPGSIIAANYTSPIEPLYLATVFDPIFTISYPRTRQLQRVSLLGAILHALSPVKLTPPRGAKLTDLDALVRAHPDRVIAVFPECTTTNGKGILPFSPSLLTAPSDAPIFPVSIRYSPSDVTTPVPGRWLRFLWDLLSNTTICIRVRIAERTFNRVIVEKNKLEGNGMSSVTDQESTAPFSSGARLTPGEQRVLDGIAEALARLGRSKRVALMMEDKAEFVKVWNGQRRRAV